MPTDAEKSANAKQHADTMRRYCRLHHEKRIADFSQGNGDWPESDVIRLVNQSREIVAGRNDGWGSVDLDDTKYLAELDEWSRNNARLHGDTEGV